MNPSAKLKRLAAELGVAVKHLLVTAPQNDPFNSGTPTDERMAEWFTSIMPATGIVHLRQQHYKHVSAAGSLLWDGEPFENTDRCWNKLTTAGKHARYLGRVDVDRIVDKRNPAPIVFAEATEFEAPRARVTEWENEWSLPAIDRHALSDVDLEPPSVRVAGYEYTHARQHRHVEVWAEKSTMNDVLEPVCAEHGVNLTTAAGYQSVTGIKDLLHRAREHDKPTVVLYINDFDPAGQHMPRAVARQLEFWSQQFNLEHRVLLQPLVLTIEQVRRYRLPRVPIKDSDRRKGNFEDRHGEGAVELDALEALHPGELARIVEAAILEHRDPTLERRFSSARGEAQRRAWDERARVLAAYKEALAALEDDARETADRYRDELNDLANRLDADMRPHRERAIELHENLLADLRDAMHRVPLPDEPRPAAQPIDPDAYLLDTRRDYLEQLRAYRRYAGQDGDDYRDCRRKQKAA